MSTRSVVARVGLNPDQVAACQHEVDLIRASLSYSTAARSRVAGMNHCVELGIFIGLGSFFLGMLVSLILQKRRQPSLTHAAVHGHDDDFLFVEGRDE
jgi:hypothetical protein